MTDPAVLDLTRHFGKEVLLDANILLLYMVGLLDRSRIPKFKRTKMFAVEDFDTLETLLKKFRAVVTTPNILTEVSNLGGELGDPVRSEFFTILTRVIPFSPKSISIAKEQARLTVSRSAASQMPPYWRWHPMIFWL